MPIIDNNIDSLEENMDYRSYNKYLDDETKRNKNNALLTITELGNQFLNEIEAKKQRQEKPKKKYIKYILKHRCYSNLESYDYYDIVNIYNEIKKENQSLLSKAFHFIFFNKVDI